MSKLNIVRLVLGLLVGLAGISVITGSLVLRGEPTCGAQVMKSDDVCILGGKAVSYEQRRNESGAINRWWLAAGTGAALLGGLLVVASLRSRQRAVPTPDASAADR